MINRIRPRLVTFDVTGTLLMTKVEEHYIRIGSQYGLSVEPRKLVRSFKSNYARLSAEHPVYGKHTGLGWRNWWRTIVYNVFTEQHCSVPKETLDKVADRLISCYSTGGCWRKYPGTIELLDYLRSRNVTIGVISNFDERLESILHDTLIRHYFAFVLTSYDAGVEKPAPAIFDEALQRARGDRMNAGHVIRASEAMHVGDMIDNDYLGATRAGWKAALIRHEEQEEEEDVECETAVPAEHVFGNLFELRQHFYRLFGADCTTGR